MFGRAALVLAVTSAGCLFKPDAAPGQASVTCFAPPMGSSSMDSDGDGITDDIDNCPSIKNASQHDEDQDCRGDECDLCPHLPIDPDVADVDKDGIGDNCDPDLATYNQFYFDPFLTRPSIWSTEPNGGNWQLGPDVDSWEQAQPSANPGWGFFGIGAIPSSGVMETVFHVNATAAADPARAIAVGVIVEFVGSCDSGCGGQVITLSRDLQPASRLWLRLSSINQGPTFTTTSQMPIDDASLDGTAVRLEVTFNSTGIRAFLTLHGKRYGPLTDSATAFSGGIGLVTSNTGAIFDHVAIIY
jgi:hypothetical protein